MVLELVGGVEGVVGAAVRPDEHHAPRKVVVARAVLPVKGSSHIGQIWRILIRFSVLNPIKLYEILPKSRDCSSDSVTDDITSDKIITGEAFSPVNTLKKPDFELIFTVCNR